jgi:hypothetical protein
MTFFDEIINEEKKELLGFDTTKIIDSRDYIKDKNFQKYSKPDVDYALSRPTRHSEREATPEEIKRDTWRGTACEWYIIQSSNGRYEKLSEKHLINHKNKSLITKHLRMQDLIDLKTGHIIEIKSWVPYYVKELHKDNNGMESLKRQTVGVGGNKRGGFFKGEQCFFGDKIIFFKKIDEYKSSFEKIIDFHNFLKDDRTINAEYWEWMQHVMGGTRSDSFEEWKKANDSKRVRNMTEDEFNNI